MHLCYICTRYMTPTQGGIGSFTQDTADGLTAAGHRVTVIGIRPLPGRTGSETLANGVRVHHSQCSTWRRPWQLGMILDRVRLVRDLRRLHRETAFDSIECPDYEGWLALGRLPDVPLIARVHGTNLLFDAELGRPGLGLEHWFEKRWLRRAHVWAAVSEYAAQSSSALCGWSPPRLRVLYNAVDTDRFAPDDTPVENGLIVFVNSICPRKGVPQLLAAMDRVVRRFPQARLLLIGGEAEPAEAGIPYSQCLLGRMPPTAAAQVTFAGAMDRITGVLPALRRAHVCCFPSLCETFGLAPAEAMAVGKPVVYTRLGPGPEVIEDGVSGLLCDPRSPTDIAERICAVLEDRGLASRLGQAARHHAVERFSRPAALLRNLEFYEDCIARPRKQARIG